MGLEHVETIVANNQPTVDFTNVFASDDGADRYVIFVDAIKPENTTANLLSVHLSADGGSTWDSGSSDYAYSGHRVDEDGSTSTRSSSGDSKFRPATPASYGVDTVGDVGTAHAKIVVHNPTNSDRATVLRSSGGGYRGGSSVKWRTAFSGGQRLTQSAIDSVRFFEVTADSNISAIFSVYKVTQTTGGAKQHIETIEANSQSSVDFTSVFDPDDGFDRYEIYADNVVASIDAENLYARLSTNGGSTWDSGTSDYAYSTYNVTSGGNTASNGSSGASEIQWIIRNVGANPASNDTAQFQMLVSEPTNAGRATVLRDNYSQNVDSFADTFSSGYTGGIRLTQSAIDSIQFFMSSGDIESGTFSVYGIGE